MKTEVTIRNCPIKIKFECPKNWQELISTDEKNIKFCNKCNHNVYYCITDDETIYHAKSGDCIAREIPMQDELPILFIGKVEEQPEETIEQKKALKWTHRESGINQVIKLDNPSKYCSTCGYPTAEYRRTCKVCGMKLK